MTGKTMDTMIPAMVFAVVFSVFVASARAQGSPGPCELYTQADAKSLFNETVSAGVVKTAMLPAGETCRYTFNKKGDVFGVTVKVSTTEAIREEGIHDSAEDVFHRQMTAQGKSAHASKTFKEIQGPGHGAFWEGTRLYVLNGDILVIITVRSVLEGSFNSREAMDAAHEEQNLALSRKVAETVLSRLAAP